MLTAILCSILFRKGVKKTKSFSVSNFKKICFLFIVRITIDVTFFLFDWIEWKTFLVNSQNDVNETNRKIHKVLPYLGFYDSDMVTIWANENCVLFKVNIHFTLYTICIITTCVYSVGRISLYGTHDEIQFFLVDFQKVKHKVILFYLKTFPHDWSSKHINVPTQHMHFVREKKWQQH